MTAKSKPTHRDPSRIAAGPRGHHLVGPPIQRTTRGVDHAADAPQVSDRNP